MHTCRMAVNSSHWIYQFQLSQHINVTVKHLGQLHVSIWKVCICDTVSDTVIVLLYVTE